MPRSRALSFRGSRVLALLGLALLVRALTPTGWMPVFENGAVTLRLCSGLAQLRHPAAHLGKGGIEHPAAKGHHHGGHDKEPVEPSQPCPFAIATVGSPVPQPLLPIVPLVPASLGLLFPLAVAIGSGLAAPPPPSTGPPLRS